MSTLEVIRFKIKGVLRRKQNEIQTVDVSRLLYIFNCSSMQLILCSSHSISLTPVIWIWEGMQIIPIGILQVTLLDEGDLCFYACEENLVLVICLNYISSGGQDKTPLTFEVWSMQDRLEHSQS